MNDKNRQTILLAATAGIVALWIGDQFVLTPLAKTWGDRSSAIVELRKSIEKGKLAIGRDRSLTTQWDNMRTNTLPSATSASEAQMFTAFDRWSQDSHVTISAIKPQWKDNDGEFRTLECHVDASGNMTALTKFLHNIEKDPMAVRVEAVELSAREQTGQDLTLSIQLSGLVLNPKE